MSLNTQKNNIAPGEYGIQMEIFKYAGEDFQYRLLYFLNLIWHGKTPPESWQKAITVPLHKKGDIKKCKNYREISLLNSGYKIYANIIKEKLLRVLQSKVRRRTEWISKRMLMFCLLFLSKTNNRKT
jgi:GTP-dependent phosphoenolpyruvate carboxykinase